MTIGQIGQIKCPIFPQVFSLKYFTIEFLQRLEKVRLFPHIFEFGQIGQIGNVNKLRRCGAREIEEFLKTFYKNLTAKFLRKSFSANRLNSLSYLPHSQNL